jgi:hypothetical protein
MGAAWAWHAMCESAFRMIKPKTVGLTENAARMELEKSLQNFNWRSFKQIKL